MSTPAQAGAILSGIQKVNGILTLASVIEGVVAPIVTGLIKDIQQKVNSDGTVEYTVVLSTGMAELQDVQHQALGDLQAINTYLVSKGQPPIPIPAASNLQASAPSADATKKT